VLTGLVVTIIAALCAAGTFWALLSVPESNVAALVLSGLLVVATAVIVAAGIAIVVAVASGSSVSAAVRRSASGFVGFIAGLAVFGAFWWVTTTIDGLWALHRGEIDALFLRHAGTARTAWLHASVAWLMWLVRWGVGLAAIGAATTGGALIGASAGVVRGLTRMLAPLPLAATILALLAGRATWPLAYWRPGTLSANAAEAVFVAVKLSALFLIGAVLVVVVLHLFARAATKSAGHSTVSASA
jgi:hypothetical protein